MSNKSKVTGLSLSVTFAAVVVFILGGALQTLGQATTGTLRGRVLDPNGAVVPGATVVAKNEATGVNSPTFTTSDEGGFVITNLLPGTYSVTVSTATGFKTKTISAIDVRLGLDTEVRIELEVGSAQETVTVTASSEELVQTTSEISSNFESRKVTDLPSNAAGGGIDTLALSVPGVTPGFGNVNSNGTTLSVNGNRARSNNFSIDGTDNNDLSIGGPSYFVSNTELVGEFQIITNNYSAQYGRNQGAIVNIVTKGGTNEFSGSAFIYHRNASEFDAMDNLERRDPNRSKKDKFISNVFGGTFGGPIIKNRAFFFGSYQGIRQAQNFTSRGANLAILPSEFTRLRAAFPGNAAIQALTSQGAFALSNFGNVRPRSDRDVELVCISATPATNCVLGGNETGFFRAAYPEREFAIPFEQDEFSLRGDVNLTSRDNLTIRYLWQDSVAVNNLGGSNGFTGDIPATSKNLSGFYTRQISSRIVNNFQATFQQLSVLFGGGCTDPLTGCIPDPSEIGNSYASIVFSGLRGVNPLPPAQRRNNGTTVQTLGGATNLPQGRVVDVYQFSDKVSWTAGNHTILFGADVRYLKNSVPFLPNINGVFRFTSVDSVVTNTPASITLAAGEPTIDYKQYDQFYFFQDDWRVFPNLTLNLGLRYEYSGQPINRLNEITLARESDPNTALYRQNLPIEARTVPAIPSDKNNIAPRLGFAWSPDLSGSGFGRLLFGEKDATVIRGGYSIAYDPVFYNILLNISTSAPTVFLDTLTGANVVPLPANPLGSAVRQAASSRLARNTFDPRFLSQTTVTSDFHSPYAIQFSLGVQRQINSSNVFEIRYVGNRGKDLFQSVNGNPLYSNLYNGFTAGGFTFPSFRSLLPSDTPAPQSCVNNPATPDNEAACNGRLLPGRGLLRVRTNSGESQYDSMQTRYNGRFLNKNLIFGASYTFSKAIDNASEIFSFGESAFAQNPFDVKEGERSLSGFDRRHSFSANFIYEVPFFKSQQGFVGKLLGGFQINGVYNLASGRPYTPSMFCNAFCGLPSYQDNGFAQTFIGFDNFRPFVGNPKAPITAAGISQIDASFIYGVPVANPNGFYSLSELNNGNVVAVTQNDVRYIFNGPGAARIFGTPFGNAPRNGERGPKLNQLNMGLFKTTNITEKFKIQLRLEAFNVLNQPNAGFGVAAGSTLPDTFLENGGVTFADFGEVALSSRAVQFGLRIIF
jgi:outer membrane receptor protein involved in Fe transport